MSAKPERRALPEGWEWKRLGDVANIIMGQSPPGSTYNENGYGFSFLQGNAEFGDKFPKHVKYTTEPAKVAPKGSVLISVRAPVGDINLANMDYCIGRGLASILLVKGDNNFLFYLLNYLKPKIEDKGTGSTFKAVSKSILNEIQIPLPPLPTQRCIVSILEKAEETKRLRAQADELTERLLHSLFLEMFGDPVKNPHKFEVIKLKNVIEIRGRVGWKGYKRTDLTQSGPLVLGATHICKDGRIDLSEPVYISRKKYVESPEIMLSFGDLVFVQRGNTIGKLGLLYLLRFF